jgi:hypothetical protein
MAFYDSSARYDDGLFYDEVVPPTPRKNRMAKIKLNLDRLSISDLLLRASDIKTKMTGNASFTTPIPPLTSLGNQITALTNSNNTYNQGELSQKQNKSARDNDVDALLATLTQLSGYVEAASGGDVVKIQSAGMDVRSSSAPATTPFPVMNLFITAGDDAGELDLQWDPMPGASRYEVQLCASPDFASGIVNLASVSKSKAASTGLTSGVKMWARVRALNAAGTGAWSDPATKMVP